MSISTIEKIKTQIERLNSRILIKRDRQETLQLKINDILSKYNLINFCSSNLDVFSEKDKEKFMARQDEYQKLEKEILDLIAQLSVKKKQLKIEEKKLHELELSKAKKDRFNRHRSVGCIVERCLNYEFLSDDDLSVLEDFLNNKSVQNFFKEKLLSKKK